MLNNYDLSFFDKIKELLAQNQLDIAIEKIQNFSKIQIPDLYNEVLIQLVKINKLRKEERIGLLSRDEVNHEYTNINYALLQLIDEFSTRLMKNPLPITTPPVFFELPDDINLEKIFGVNHLKNISWLEKGLKVSKSVCRVVTYDGFGTGFLVKNGYLITNNHVIKDIGTAKKTYVEFNYQEDVTDNLLPSYKYKLDISTFKTNQYLDYSIIKIVDDPITKPLSFWGFLELETASKPTVNDHVIIIQHPEGGPKQIALTANQVANIFEYRLQYTTDTLPGSSGSPVLNDNWKVIAIHHAGGNLKINKLGQRRFLNEGILISEIFDKIKKEIFN